MMKRIIITTLLLGVKLLPNGQNDTLKVSGYVLSKVSKQEVLAFLKKKKGKEGIIPIDTIPHYVFIPSKKNDKDLLKKLDSLEENEFYIYFLSKSKAN